MAMNRKYAEGFINHLDASQRGEVVYIPLGLERMDKIFNIMQSRYTLVFGATGSGKTSFVDFTYILNPWCYLKNNEDKDMYWEVNYFSLERKAMFKHARWVSWLMYRDDTELLVSGDQIMGWGDGPINSQGYKLVRSYDEEMSELLEHVDIRDGKINLQTLERRIKNRRQALGTYFYSDDIGVKRDDELIYVERFDDKGLTETTKLGEKKYIELTWQGKLFRLYEDDYKYFPKNPKQFVFFIVDGINLLGDKDQMDKISVALADARDRFGFSIVMVSQQNRAQGDIQRLKHHGADLSPQLEDVFKSSQMGFDSDLIIGLFDPYKYKAWDKEGKFGGYMINPPSGIGTPCMLTPDGRNRFRSAHILKNTFGPADNKFGMKFLGECGHFATLPYPDTFELEAVYDDIKRGI